MCKVMDTWSEGSFGFVGLPGGILRFWGFYRRGPPVLWVLPQESSGFMDFTRGILWFYGFYRRDPPVLCVLSEGSSGFVVLAEGSSGFASFLHLDCHFSHTKNDAITYITKKKSLF